MLAALNRLCVRLVFCLYAEDAGIFPKDSLRRLIEAAPLQYLRGQLLRLFQTLDTPIGKRDPYLEHELAIFPYTNGGLFRNASVSGIPPLTEEIRKLLIGASQFDWREITPTIFGALFESTLNPATRRAGGINIVRENRPPTWTPSMRTGRTRTTANSTMFARGIRRRRTT